MFKCVKGTQLPHLILYSLMYWNFIKHKCHKYWSTWNSFQEIWSKVIRLGSYFANSTSCESAESFLACSKFPPPPTSTFHSFMSVYTFSTVTGLCTKFSTQITYSLLLDTSSTNITILAAVSYNKRAVTFSHIHFAEVIVSSFSSQVNQQREKGKRTYMYGWILRKCIGYELRMRVYFSTYIDLNWPIMSLVCYVC